MTEAAAVAEVPTPVKYVFELDTCQLRTFCAWAELGNFRILKYPSLKPRSRDAYDYISTTTYLQEVDKEVHRETILEVIRRKIVGSPYSYFLMGDVITGEMSKAIFAFLPEKFETLDGEVTVEFTEPYYNANSGNTVHNVILHVDRHPGPQDPDFSTYECNDDSCDDPECDICGSSS